MAVKRVDYSSMQDWVESSAIQDMATALRTDSASVADATEHIGPAWRDLRAFMMIGVTGDHPFFYAGDDVSSYGESVKSGGENIAKYMEECVQTLQGLESDRTALIERADDINLWVAANPFQDTMYPPDQIGFCDQLTAEREYYGRQRDDVVKKMAKANKDYVNALNEMADKVRALDDDGTKPGWLGTLIDVAIAAGGVVGIFYPPVGKFTSVAAMTKAYCDQYQEHRRELAEDHPEMYDSEISREAFKAAAVDGTLSAAEEAVMALLGGTIVKKILDGKPLSPLERKIVDWAISQVYGEVDHIPQKGWDTPDSDPDAPRYPNDQAVSEITAAQEQATKDAEDRAKTKDYDGDGFTDEPFLPSSQEVNMGELEVAEDVKIDWTGPLNPDRPKNNPVPPPRLPSADPTSGTATSGSAPGPAGTNQTASDSVPTSHKPRKPVMVSKTPLIRS